MKKYFYIAGTILVVTGVAVAAWWSGKHDIFTQGKPTQKIGAVIEKPLEKYAIEKLAAQVVPGQLNLDPKNNAFEFAFNPNLDGKTTKKTTGQVRIPEGQGPFPVVVMLRGYVDQEIYQTGIGTQAASQVLVKNGFITLAPDFLGYANSDPEAADIFESRFQTYATAISLIKSVDQIKDWDGQNLFLWGHSNGGQIAITVLEATGWEYPTVLWAPVTKPFPYSILYYTDESEDRGKLIRRELASFEDLYDVDLFSLERYADRIKAPIQLHQGTADDAVPVDWSQEFVKKLEEAKVDITYYEYPGSDHNLRPAWNQVVNRDIIYYRQHAEKVSKSD